MENLQQSVIEATLLFVKMSVKTTCKIQESNDFSKTSITLPTYLIQQAIHGVKSFQHTVKEN